MYQQAIILFNVLMLQFSLADEFFVDIYEIRMNILTPC